MASRYVYSPCPQGPALVSAIPVEFKWVAGMAKTQKQKTIRSLHQAAIGIGFTRILEISSKSEVTLGVKLSAFNLPYNAGTGLITTVENAFQAGKVFRNGGPFLDLLQCTPMDAKKDPRLLSSGELIGFRMGAQNWPCKPVTAFYDWIYISALLQFPELAEKLLDYDGFTDIEFNPKRSLNCQASSAALFVALLKRGELENATANPEAFLKYLSNKYNNPRPVQASLL